MASLKRVFETYAGWGGGVDRGALDRVRWGKVLRDCLLVSESGPLPARKADAVFGKVLPVSSRALNFIQVSARAREHRMCAMCVGGWAAVFAAERRHMLCRV